MTDMTLGFYTSNAEAYAADTAGPNPRLFGFLARCKPQGKILELGTGGGEDAIAILERGFDLDATDGSPELAAIASHRIGREVKPMLFDELDAIATYDAVYACAALTHVPRADLTRVVAKIHRAMVGNGMAWASFKAGDGEGLDGLGRYYSYLAPDELVALWQAAAPWQSLETELWLGSAYDRKPTEWIAITARK